MITGTITADNQIVSLDLANQSKATVFVSGHWYGKLKFEGRMASVWIPVQGVLVGPEYTQSTIDGTTQSNTQWKFDVAGLAGLRVRACAKITGMATASIESIADLQNAAASLFALGLHRGSIALDFGEAGERIADVVILITGQSAIRVDSLPRLQLIGSTLDNDSDAHDMAASLVFLSANWAIDGVGFTVRAISGGEVTGQFNASYEYAV